MTKKHPPLVLTCDYCKQPFKRLYSYHKYLVEKRNITVKFCSYRCKSLSQNLDTKNGSIKDLYLSGKSLVEVGNILGVSSGTVRNRLKKMGVPMRSKTAHLFTNKNPTKGKGHTKETKEKIRQATKKQFANPENRLLAAHNQALAMASGKIPTVSKIEDMVASVLDDLSIKYIRQFAIRDPKNGRCFACVDFLLENKVILEVNGSFWHADPRLYPDGPKKPSQRKTVANDKRKAKILKELGYSLIVIWEIDIRENPQNAVSMLLSGNPFITSKQSPS